MMLLSQKLALGYHLNAHLQELLGRPVDARSLEEAMAVSEEVSRVFLDAMAELEHVNSRRANLERMAPEKSTESSIAWSNSDKDKRISGFGQEVSPLKKSREKEFARREITSSPHLDGYEWKKYGQKSIQNRIFPRYYYKCSRDRRCEARKKVQQQDGSSREPHMYEVTYVNEHTCHALRANGRRGNNGDAAAGVIITTSSPGATDHHAFGVVDTASRPNDDADLFGLLPPRHVIGGHGIGSAQEEDKAIVSCLAAVIGGGGAAPSWPPPPPPAEPISPLSDPAAAAYVLTLQEAVAGHYSPSLEGRSAAGGGAMGAGFPWDDPSSFRPAAAEEEAGGRHQLVDVHMADAARLAGTVWPQYYDTCGAWRGT